MANNFLQAMKLLEPDTQEKVVGHNAKEKKVDAVIVVKVDIVAEQDGQETDVMGRWAKDSEGMFVPKKQQLVIINKKFDIISICDIKIESLCIVIFIFMFFIVGGPENDNPTTEDPGYAATSTEAAPTTQPPTTGMYAELYKQSKLFCIISFDMQICLSIYKHIPTQEQKTKARSVGGNVEERKAPVHGVATKACVVDKVGQEMVVTGMLEALITINVLKHQKVN